LRQEEVKKAGGEGKLKNRQRGKFTCVYMFCIFLIKKKYGRCMMTFNEFIWLSQEIQPLS